MQLATQDGGRAKWLTTFNVLFGFKATQNLKKQVVVPVEVRLIPTNVDSLKAMQSLRNRVDLRSKLNIWSKQVGSFKVKLMPTNVDSLKAS